MKAMVGHHTSILLIACLLGSAGCCKQGPDILSIWRSLTTTWVEGVCGFETINWNGITEVTVNSSILVIYQNDDEDLIQTAIELYDGDRRIPLHEETSMAHSCSHGCPSPRTLYLLDVPAGEYTLVHRRSTGTGKPVNTTSSDDPWMTFDGEEALVTNLVVTNPE